MNKIINNTLLRFVGKKNIIKDIGKLISQKKSNIIEIVGPSGTGKSYIFHELHKKFQETNQEHECIFPKTFCFNQLKPLIQIISNISDKEYFEFVSKAKKYDIANEYDFFYFLSETLNKKHLFDSKIIFIDDCNLLDSYSKNFIQYIVQYASEANIHFITFTTESTFPFSTKFTMEYLSTDSIFKILSTLFSDQDLDFTTASDILKRITGGNIFVLENILNQYFHKEIPQKFDLSNFLDKNFAVNTTYSALLQKLSAIQLDIVIYISLLDGSANMENLQQFFKADILLNNLNFLKDMTIIVEIDKSFFIKKALVFYSYFDNLSDSVKKKYVENFLKVMTSINFMFHDPTYYHYFIKDYSIKLFDQSIEYLSLINDYETVRDLYLFVLDEVSNPQKQVEILKNLGITNKRLNKKEASAENFRQALKLCTKHLLPADEIIYLLAESLHQINSASFALEIIKKYSPNSIDFYWKSKILRLKTEILVNMEKFSEASQYADEAISFADKIEDKRQRDILMADAKKIKGYIYYYLTHFDKAEIEFFDAEILYKKADFLEGLAAIYNNIGVIALFQGEWKKTEEFYLKSLKLEEQRYNLNGVSVCYNNLGSLLEDKGEHEKSLNYLYEALRIQKLLSDRYNITNIYNNIGITYMDNGKYKEALKALELSLQTAMNFNLSRNIIASLNNIGALFFKSGKWTKAIEYYERAIDKSKENNLFEGLVKSYNNLGELYEQRGEFTLAYDLYFKGIELLPQITDDVMKAELHGNIGSVLTHLHKFGEAYGYLVESYDFFKSLDANDKNIIEACQKQAFYFIKTRNYESANYYLKSALKMAESINNKFEIGLCYYLQSFLDKKDKKKSRNSLEKAIEIFIETNNNFELAQANYELAGILYELSEWEQALQILKTNKKLIKDFDAIKFLEKNDILVQKIMKEYAVELKETRNQESLLTRFYEITQNLNSLTDFDLILDTALENLVELSEADGGLLFLYNNPAVSESWEYKIFQNFSAEDENYDNILEIVQKTFSQKKNQNIKQPHFAPQYNNIISFPLVIRNNNLGVFLLFTKHGSHYFTEKMYNLLNALCNQIVVIIENIKHDNMTRSHAIIREELNTANPFSNIIGKSEKMHEIFKVIGKIKDTPATVLLEGESGTGKELIARAIHYTSNKRNKKFIAQYCGALPETLLESELFGHVKGAYTGAAYDKKGLFEVADGGTFFLDEIGDISLSIQAKILRFLQEGEVKRVGSTKTQKVNVRVICATNANLNEKVKKGEFRLDLYYRLNVIKIKVPSLKERKSDIPLLAIHFLDKYSKKMNKNVIGITDESMKYLSKCDWPGNIRQLENEIERAVTLADPDSFIKPSDLSEEVFKYSENTETLGLLNKATLKEAVEDLEKRMIVKALTDRNWNQTQASKDLGLSRQGLIKKIKRYELEK